MSTQLRKKYYFFITLLIFISLSCNLLNSASENPSPSNPVQPLNPTPKTVVNLVGRSPVLWMPEPSEFGTFGNIQPQPYSFTNIEYSDYQTDSEKFKVLSQAGRIINYGYEWFSKYCDDALMLDISAAYVSTTLYSTSDGASAGYNFFL